MAQPLGPIEVQIGHEIYRLNEIPKDNSQIVKECKEQLLTDEIDLKTFVDDLRRVGSFVRLAYYAVGAAGPQFVKNKIEIYELAIDVTKLGDKSTQTISRFKTTSSRVAENLQTMYQYLLDNLETMAMTTFTSVSEQAGKMAKAAEELHSEFDKEAEKVQGIIRNTEEAIGVEAQHIIDHQLKYDEMKLRIAHQEELIRELHEKEKEAAMRRRDLEDKQDEAIAELNSFGSIFKSFLKTITVTLKFLHTEASKGNEKEAEQKIEALKTLRQEAYKIEQTLFEERKEALSTMNDFAVEILRCDTNEEMADIAEKALFKAVGALKELSAMMLRAAHFWKQLQDYCKDMADCDMQQQIQTALTYPKEERFKVWTSEGFKCKAMWNYASWAALKCLCSDCILYIKTTRAELYKNITENPSDDKCRKDLKLLSKKFQANVKSDQKALEQKKIATAEKHFSHF